MKRIFFVLSALVTSSILFLSSCSKDSKKEDPAPSSSSVISAPVGKIDYKIGGTAFEVPGGAQITDNQIILGGSVNLKGISIVIARPAVTGTYNAQGATLANLPEATVTYFTSLSDSYSSAFADGGKSVGTVAITEIDQTNKTISGTFTSTVVSEDGVTSISLTEGSFNKLPYVKDAGSTLTAKVNGASFVGGQVTGVLQGDYVGINAQSVSGSQILAIAAFYNITPGTYDIGGLTAPVTASYTSLTDSTVSNFTSTHGTLVIKKHDTSLKRIEGTFSFDSNSIDPSSTDKTSVTEGTFAVTYF